MLLTEGQLNMLRKVGAAEVLHLEAVRDDEDLRALVRLTMERYVAFHGNQQTRTGDYRLTLKGFRELEGK